MKPTQTSRSDDEWPPYLVATATFGVLPLALAVICVSSAVMTINSGWNKNLYAFFNVQLSLCDFFMAVGPMVLFFAMVTGRIDLQASGANHYGCLTAVVLSYTTSDISVTILVLYVVAAYHHIYYTNISWYQAQISKKKLQWGSHIVFLVMCVINMYVLETSMEVRDLCTSLLPDSFFGHTIYILFMLAVAWLGVLICGCPIFISHDVPSQRNTLFDRLRLGDIMEEDSQRIYPKIGSSIPGSLNEPRRFSEESFHSGTTRADSSTEKDNGSASLSKNKTDGKSLRQIWRNWIYLLDTPEGKSRVDGLSRATRSRRKPFFLHHMDGESAAQKNLPPRPLSVFWPSSNKCVHIPEGSDIAEGNDIHEGSDAATDDGQEFPNSTSDHHPPRARYTQNASDKSKGHKNTLRIPLYHGPVSLCHSTSFRWHQPRFQQAAVATSRSLPSAQRGSVGDEDELQRHSVDLGQLNNITTESSFLGESATGRGSTSSVTLVMARRPSTGIHQTARGSGSTEGQMVTVPTEGMDSESNLDYPKFEYVDVRTLWTQTDSRDLKPNIGLKRARKNDGDSHKIANYDKDGEFAWSAQQPKKKNRNSQTVDRRDAEDKVITLRPLVRKRSPSADTVVPDITPQTREETNFPGPGYCLKGSKSHDAENTNSKRTVEAHVTQANGFESRSSGDYEAQETQTKTSLLELRQMTSILPSWACQNSAHVEAIQEQRRAKHVELLSKIRINSAVHPGAKERDSAEGSIPVKDSKYRSMICCKDQEMLSEETFTRSSSGPDCVSSKGRQQKPQKQRRGQGGCWISTKLAEKKKISRSSSARWVQATQGPVYRPAAQSISSRGRLVFWRLLILVCVHSVLWFPALLTVHVTRLDITQLVQMVLLLVAWLRPLVSSSLMLWFTVNEP